MHVRLRRSQRERLQRKLPVVLESEEAHKAPSPSSAHTHNIPPAEK